MSRHLRLLAPVIAAITCTTAAAIPTAVPLLATNVAVHQPAATGTITGNVRLTTRVRSARLPAALYPSRSVGRHDPPAVSELRNVVVFLRDIAFSGRLPTATVEMRQEHETFIPHILPITRGSTVSFPNDDPFFHNVFSLSRTATFDLGRYPMDQARSETFDKTGLVKIYCRIHSQMSAAVFVFDHPFFTVPADDGTFTLPGVPAGQSSLVGWHQRVGERALSVRVAPGGTTDIQLTLPVEDMR